MIDKATTSEIDLDDILGWVEFACWTALVLMPFLQRVNGPSVSTDQAVVRTALLVMAVVGTIVLRIVNGRRGTRRRTMTLKETKNEYRGK